VIQRIFVRVVKVFYTVYVCVLCLLAGEELQWWWRVHSGVELCHSNTRQ